MNKLKKLFGQKNKSSKLIKSLASTNFARREKAVAQVLFMRNQEALNAVEEALRRLTKKKHIDFFDGGGVGLRASQQKYAEVLELARTGRFAENPGYIQSLIPAIGYLNQDLMEELKRVNKEALAIYQLLGIQMQLSTMLR